MTKSPIRYWGPTCPKEAEWHSTAHWLELIIHLISEPKQAKLFLPGDAIKWLLEDGLIEDSSKPAKKVETPVEETPLTVIDLSDGISSEEAKVILSSTPEAETIVSEDE